MDKCHHFLLEKSDFMSKILQALKTAAANSSANYEDCDIEPHAQSQSWPCLYAQRRLRSKSGGMRGKTDTGPVASMPVSRSTNVQDRFYRRLHIILAWVTADAC